MGERLRTNGATLDVLGALLGPEDKPDASQIAKATGRPASSVLPILARLERDGWVISESYVDPKTQGRGQRRYRLSPDGMAKARSIVAEEHLVPGQSLAAWVDGELSPAARRRASLHTLDCDACRSMLPGTSGNVV
ncbi:zf-HC2 domain-containing protein [Actinomadura sp. 9N215]|uniref:zf-HC2 domain-containing protein n=1 Tax=Actinomadura sp. 9N215 TaxID=3375150 RepID=UPI0037AF0D31